MAQSQSFRRDMESQRRLLHLQLDRLFGSDPTNLPRGSETLTQLDSRPTDAAVNAQNRADLDTTRAILDQTEGIAAFYNPDQPRDAHGRWTSGGALDVPKAVAKLEKAGHKPLDQCATKVREAIAAGGIVFDSTDQRNSAKDYDEILPKYGFVAEANASTGQGYPPDKDYKPQAGDVVVIQGTSTSPHGHMAMFNGKQWISDYWQSIRPGDPTGFWPGESYRRNQPSYVIYRHKKQS